MNKTNLSASGAFISFLCAVVTLIGLFKSGEALYAVLALIFAFVSLAFVGYGIDGSEIAEALSNFFSEKGGER